jgi:hypothetical protein
MLLRRANINLLCFTSHSLPSQKNWLPHPSPGLESSRVGQGGRPPIIFTANLKTLSSVKPHNLLIESRYLRLPPCIFTSYFANRNCPGPCLQPSFWPHSASSTSRYLGRIDPFSEIPRLEELRRHRHLLRK